MRKPYPCVKAPIHYALSYDRQTLTAPSDSELCLIDILRAIFSSDTRQCPTVKSESVCSHSNRMFCPTVLQECPIVDRAFINFSRSASLCTFSLPDVTYTADRAIKTNCYVSHLPLHPPSPPLAPYPAPLPLRTSMSLDKELLQHSTSSPADKGQATLKPKANEKINSG